MIKTKSAILLVHCPDREGIVLAVTSFISNNDGNILYLDQHVDYEKGRFFMRVEWDLSKFSLIHDQIAGQFENHVAIGFDMQWQ